MRQLLHVTITKTQATAASMIHRDILAAMALPSAELDSLRGWLSELLVANEYAKLEQGGHAYGSVPLRRVFIDLPVSRFPSGYTERTPFLSHFLSGPTTELAPLLTDIGDSPQAEEEEEHSPSSAQRLSAREGRVLLVGGPGQGKSTLGQLASQLCRAALLKPYVAGLTTHQREVIETLLGPPERRKGRNSRVGDVSAPSRPLLPLNVTLPDLAVWLAERQAPRDDDIPAIIRFIAALPSATKNSLSAKLLFTVASTLPVLLVLDGFDEVGSIHDRQAVVVAARELLIALARQRVAVKIIAATRPQGYAGELSALGVALSARYLVPLETSEAISYAEKLVRAKISGADQQQKLLVRIREAASDAATSRLLTTPLQVTILTALVQQQGRVPRERWRLFSSYFDYTYKREIERETYASRLLAEERVHIEAIHARVGLLLQTDGERDGGTGRMSKEHLNRVIEEVLVEDEVADEVRADLRRDILRAAEERLVFLVEPEPGKFGFEIRSFQEFMAAWAITSGREEDVESRLRQISSASLFRNVLLFATSRLYSESSPLRELIPQEICLAMERTDDVARLSRSGALLALEILEEGAALQQAKRARALMESASVLLALPPGPEHARLARVANIDTAASLMLAIESVLHTTPDSPAAWTTLIHLAEAGVSAARAYADTHWARITDGSSVLRAWRMARVPIGEWLATRLSALAESVEIEDLAYTEFTDAGSESWAGYISRGLRALSPRTILLDRGRPHEDSASPPRPNGEPPAAWLPWLHLTEFRNSPSSLALARALRAIAKQVGRPAWRNIAAHTTWPLAACLLLADESSDLETYANAAEAGELGDITDWAEAEPRWQKAVTVNPVLEPLLSGMPWSKQSLRFGPPFSILAHPTASYQLGTSTRRSATADTQLATHFSRKDIAPGVRQLIANHLMRGIRTRRTSLDPELLGLLVSETPASLGSLIPKPKWMTHDTWIQLLASIPPADSLWIEGSLDSALAAFVESGGLAACARAAVNMLVYSRHFRRAFSGKGTSISRAMTSALAALAAGDPRAQLDAAILRLYLDPYPADDAHLLRILESSEFTEPRALSLLSVLRHGAGPRETRLRLLSSTFHIFERFPHAGREAVITLREFLQSRGTGLQDGAIWDRLRLPKPKPFLAELKFHSSLIPEVPVVISGIEINSVRGLRSLRLDELAVPPSGKGQWTVIIGQNGTGKTTLLRSIAVALRNARDPSIWPDDAFRAPWPSSEGDEARVVVRLASGTAHETRLRGGLSGLNVDQRPAHNRPRLFPLFAYGCRRGSALGGSAREVNLKDDGGPEVGTLFSEGRDILHASTWLMILEGDAAKSNKSRSLYEAVTDALCLLMDVAKIRVLDKAVWVTLREGERELPFEMLSDAYLTAAGWFLDLIARYAEFAARSGDDGLIALDSMRGLVLIDEIDLHLHPRWQVEVISRTRRLLPSMSFVVTSHNPLTLVGARPEEIWILADDGAGQVTATRGVDAPMLLTGGQIYRRYFGIEDIYPEHVGRKLARFGFLSGYPLRTDEEEAEVHQLSAELAQDGIMPGWEIVSRQVAS